MSEAPEPQIGDVLAAVVGLAAEMRRGFEQTAARLDDLSAQVTQVRADVAAVRADVSQVRADIAAVKVDTAYTERYIADSQDAIRRHLADPEAHDRAA